MKQRVIAVLGGDMRMHFAAKKLAQLGFDVREWGRAPTDDATTFSDIASQWLADVDVLMLPLPTSLDGIHLHTPFCTGGDRLRIETLLSAAPHAVWLVGRMNESMRMRAEWENIRWSDYFDSEILQLKNALPTAEGAIEIALHELPVVLDGTQIAVLGYGRIGEVLSAKLKALGARPTVYARRLEACVRAELAGCQAKRIVATPEGGSMLDFDKNIRLIFNTIPSRLLTRSVLMLLPRECIIIDLASAPGGVEMNAAKELGISVLWATALPGKCAPESAGIILAETVHSILETIEWPSDF